MGCSGYPDCTYIEAAAKRKSSKSKEKEAAPEKPAETTENKNWVKQEIIKSFGSSEPFFKRVLAAGGKKTKNER